MADGRVRCRHVVEAVHLLDLRVERPAHDEPHHQLDAFGARLAHVVDVRHLRERLGVRDQPVEEALIQLPVDQPRARPLQLVAHAAGAPDLHVEIFVERLDRATHRLAELHSSDCPDGGGYRTTLTASGITRHGQRRLTEHQRQRHGEPVVHVHLVDDGEVEVLLDHGLRDVRRRAPDGPAPTAPAAVPSPRRPAGNSPRSRSRRWARCRG